MKRFLLLFVFLLAHTLLFGQSFDAKFSYDKMVGCGPMTVNFQDQSTSPYPIMSWQWFFGDGDSSRLQNPVHVYTQPGKYTVSLAIQDNKGNYTRRELSGFMVVTPGLDIGKDHLVCTIFDPNNRIILKNKLAAAGDSSIGKYHWSTGDSTASISVNTAGIYRVSYEACGKYFWDTTNVYVSNSSMKVSEDTTSDYWTNDTYNITLSTVIPSNRAAIKAIVINWGDGKISNLVDRSTIMNISNFGHGYLNPQGAYQISFLTPLKEQNGFCDTAAVYNMTVRPALLSKPGWSGKDTVIIRGDTLRLDAGNPGGVFYWYTSGANAVGDNTNILKITQAGEYSVYMRKGIDKRFDTLRVRVREPSPTIPNAHIGFVKMTCNNIWLADSSTVTGAQITRRHWTFGDGSFSDTAHNVQHVYSQNGNYKVQLIVTNNLGENDTTNYIVTITANPDARLGPDATIQQGSIVLGTGTSQGPEFTYRWSTGDTTRTITVSKNGYYWLTVTNTACQRSISDTVWVGGGSLTRPQAYIGIYDRACAAVVLTDSSRVAPGTSIIGWHWDFGDGSTDTTMRPVHVYTDNRTYNVQLIVTNNLGEKDTANHTLFFNIIPIAALGPDTTIQQGSIVLGTGNSQGPGIRYRWSSGDTTRTITISRGGTYWVRISNPDVCTNYIVYDTIKVYPLDTVPVVWLIPSCTFNRTSCYTIQITDSSKISGGVITHWRYDFGDNITDTTQNPTHTYDTAGVYSITQTVTSSFGDTLTYKFSAWLLNKPSINLGKERILKPGGIVIGMDDYLSIYNYSYLWSTGDTTNKIKITQPGTYWLKIIDNLCGSSYTDTVRIIDTVSHPTAQFTPDKQQCTTVRFTDQSTTAAGTSITSRQWSFGDNTTDTAQNPLHTYSQRGEYTVSLVVVNSVGKRDTATTTLYFAPLLVDLGADTTLAAAGDSLLLDARKPDNSGDAYLWSTGSTQPVIVVYTSGSYWVKVTTCGTTVTDTITVTIPAVPPASSGLQAGFGFLQTGCRTYRFTDTSKITTGSISHWAWQFGDNTTDTLPNPVHTYSQPGNYIVTLVVTDNSGKQDTAIKLIVNTAIAVNLGQDLDTLRPGSSIRLSAPYPAGSNYSFHWSTGDTTAAITITQPGTYALRVTDRWCGTSAADTINISFANPAGINAAIGIQGRNCTSVYFLDESTALQPIVKWEWSFGDGTTDTTQSPQHLFAADGQYLVTLVVTDSQGATDTTTRNVELINKPNLELGADIILHPGDTVMLGADFPNTTRTWSTGETGPVIAITTPGTYSVTVYYCNGSVSDTIHVYADSIPAKLEAKFVADKLQCTTVKFTNQSTTPAGTSIISRQWSFGDNTTDTAQSPVHTYSQRGTYTVSLLIVNSAGQRDTAFTAIYFAPVLVNLGADTTLAAGSSLLLDARKPNNSGDTYLWSTGATTPTITVTQAGTYWVKVSACNTVVTDSIRITRPAEPENPASVGNTTTVNANDSLAVTASFDHSFNSNNVFTIQLLQGTNTGGKKAGELDGAVTNLAIIPGTDPRISVKVSIPDTIPCGQDYRVRIVSSSPADTTDWSSKFAVINTPVATLQQRGDSLFAGKALTYQWYFNGAALTSATTAAIRAKANGQYYVIVSNGGTCRSTSTTVNMVITAVPDITVGENVVRAFPNPTAGLVYVRFEKPLLKPVDLIVHDVKGNTLYRRQVKDQLTEINLGTLPKGIYYLEVAGYGKPKAMRIILQ